MENNNIPITVLHIAALCQLPLLFIFLLQKHGRGRPCPDIVCVLIISFSSRFVCVCVCVYFGQTKMKPQKVSDQKLREFDLWLETLRSKEFTKQIDACGREFFGVRVVGRLCGKTVVLRFVLYNKYGIQIDRYIDEYVVMHATFQWVWKFKINPSPCCW